MSAHTPGPWRYDGTHEVVRDGGPCVDVLATCVRVASVPMPSYPPADNDSRGLTMHANARLIAAAPALLYMLREVTIEVCDGVGVQPNDPWYATINKARALLAEVDGG